MAEERSEEDGRQVAEALEQAVIAVESEPPGHVMAEHVRLRKGDRAKSWAAVLTALAALIASVGAFLKTLDHGVSENVYNTLSENIVKLSDQQQKTSQDVAMLRGYLDGLSRAPLPTATSAAPVSTGSSASVPTSVPVVDAGAVFVARDAGHPRTLASLAGSPPPVVAPPAPPVKPPSFAAAISK
jgi:hypothetical protein